MEHLRWLQHCDCLVEANKLTGKIYQSSLEKENSWCQVGLFKGFHLSLTHFLRQDKIKVFYITQHNSLRKIELN